MSNSVAIFGVFLAALATWLVVRFINKRERWVKRTMIGLLVVVVAYPASFGPACWVADRKVIEHRIVLELYEPLAAVIVSCPRPLRTMMFRYGDARAPADSLPLCTSRVLFLNEMLRRQRTGDPDFVQPVLIPADGAPTPD